MRLAASSEAGSYKYVSLRKEEGIHRWMRCIECIREKIPDRNLHNDNALPQRDANKETGRQQLLGHRQVSAGYYAKTSAHHQPCIVHSMAGSLALPLEEVLKK